MRKTQEIAAHLPYLRRFARALTGSQAAGDHAESGENGGPLVTVTAAKDLPDYGWVRFRKAEKAEPHGWQPQTVRLLQTITGATKAGATAAADSTAAWTAFTTQATEKEPAVLRDLLEVRQIGRAHV